MTIILVKSSDWISIPTFSLNLNLKLLHKGKSSDVTWRLTAVNKCMNLDLYEYIG